MQTVVESIYEIGSLYSMEEALVLSPDLSKEEPLPKKPKGLNSLLIPACMAVGFAWTILMSLTVIVLFWINHQWGHNGERLWARVWCRLLGIRVRLIGAENLPKGGVI